MVSNCATSEGYIGSEICLIFLLISVKQQESSALFAHFATSVFDSFCVGILFFYFGSSVNFILAFGLALLLLIVWVSLALLLLIVSVGLSLSGLLIIDIQTLPCVFSISIIYLLHINKSR